VVKECGEKVALFFIVKKKLTKNSKKETGLIIF